MERNSKPRTEVLEYLKNTFDHPTADQIYLHLKNNNSTASRGTVYRNLGKLVEEGKIEKIVTNGEASYDYIREPHIHLVCNDCGSVNDYFDDEILNKVNSHIKNKVLNTASCLGISITGTCMECQKKKG